MEPRPSRRGFDVRLAPCGVTGFDAPLPRTAGWTTTGTTSLPAAELGAAAAAATASPSEAGNGLDAGRPCRVAMARCPGRALRAKWLRVRGSGGVRLKRHQQRSGVPERRRRRLPPTAPRWTASLQRRPPPPKMHVQMRRPCAVGCGLGSTCGVVSADDVPWARPAACPRTCKGVGAAEQPCCCRGQRHARVNVARLVVVAHKVLAHVGRVQPRPTVRNTTSAPVPVARRCVVPTQLPCHKARRRWRRWRYPRSRMACVVERLELSCRAPRPCARTPVRPCARTAARIRPPMTQAHQPWARHRTYFQRGKPGTHRRRLMVVNRAIEDAVGRDHVLAHCLQGADIARSAP